MWITTHDTWRSADTQLKQAKLNLTKIKNDRSGENNDDNKLGGEKKMVVKGEAVIDDDSEDDILRLPFDDAV